MAFSNPFMKDTKSYKRNIDPVGQYIEQAATYLSIQTGDDLDSCKKRVQEILRDKTLAPKVHDPIIEFLHRPNYEDRHPDSTNLSNYINTAVRDGRLIAPTLTTYAHPSVKESLIVKNVELKINNRKIAKKAQFKHENLLEQPEISNDPEAKRVNDELATFYKGEQTNNKLSNNAVSGAMCSASTPLFNPTGHSTLTSTCRTTSGLGNANNEKLLSGNRHYWKPDIVLNNITSIISNTDYVLFRKLLIPSGPLRIPTVEETMECITYSSNLYWRSNTDLQNIRDYVSKLTDEQRASFVYTGDLYHIKKYNNDFMRGFITDLAKGVRVNEHNLTDQDSLEIINSTEEDIVFLARQILQTEYKGRSKDHKTLINDPVLLYLANTILNIKDIITRNSDFINAIFITNNVPASVAYFPESIRRAALTSDTDSTIFTVQDWQIWYSGELSFNDEAMAIAATMIFLAAQSIVHVLAVMSSNFGLAADRLKVIAMKNEYKFDVFVPTSVGKHYFATMSCQEGNIFSKRKMEIKGVHLKNSNSPKSIVEHAEKLMEFITNKTLACEKISILEVLRMVSQLERDIIDSISKGEIDYLRLAQIKEAAAYKKDPKDSPYQYHTLWQTVFADKYMSMPEPSYLCVKVNTVLINPTATRTWLAGIKDKDIQTKMTNWLASAKKTELPTFYIPLDVLFSHKMPIEIFEAINTRKIVSDLCGMQYLILETLGFYIESNGGSVLVSDNY